MGTKPRKLSPEEIKKKFHSKPKKKTQPTKNDIKIQRDRKRMGSTSRNKATLLKRARGKI